MTTVLQSFDEELRRFIREDIISIPASAGGDRMLERIQAYIRRQRNQLPLDKPERRHYSLLNKQCFGDVSPHQLSSSRLRKIFPEEHL